MPTPPSYTPEDVNYITSNLGIISYPDMALERNLSLSCIKRLASKIKKNQTIRTDPIEPNRTDPIEPNRTDPIEPNRTDPIEPNRTDPIINARMASGLTSFNPIEPNRTDPIEPNRSESNSKFQSARLESIDPKELEFIHTTFPSLYPYNSIFNLFMKKLEKSNSFASKHLKEKLNVKGKHKKINKERVIRNIRDTLDVICE